MFGKILKLSKKLSDPLLLVFLIVAVLGYFLLNPSEDMDKVPVFNKWLYGILCLITIILAFRIYQKKEDASRAVEEMSVAAGELSISADELNVAKKELDVTTTEKEVMQSVVQEKYGASARLQDSWSRPMLRWPFEPVTIEEVFGILTSCRKLAAELVCKQVGDKDFKDENIRANVFLPDSQGAREGDVCNLCIPVVPTHAPDGLQRGMDKADERSLLFRPNQGATGRVFVEGCAIGALTKPAWLYAKTDEEQRSIKRWIYVPLRPDQDAPTLQDLTASGDQFELSIWQEHKIHNRLAWIISLPLMIRYKDDLEVVGVLNVDCLEHVIEPSAIREIFYQIAPFAGALSGILHDVPTDRVMIFRFSSHDS